MKAFLTGKLVSIHYTFHFQLLISESNLLILCSFVLSHHFIILRLSLVLIVRNARMQIRHERQTGFGQRGQARQDQVLLSCMQSSYCLNFFKTAAREPVSQLTIALSIAVSSSIKFHLNKIVHIYLI